MAQDFTNNFQQFSEGGQAYQLVSLPGFCLVHCGKDSLLHALHTATDSFWCM